MGNKMRILYAEDYELEAELTKIILEENEFIVDIAADGEKAWDAYNRQKPDILLLDLNMPQKDGIEVTRLIRKKDPLTRIIIYTSHGEPEKEIAALDAGADEFIPKNRTPDVLIAHLKALRHKMITCLNVPHVYELSPITTFNVVTRTVTIQGEATLLSSSEARLLQLLCVKSNQIANMDYIMKGIWKDATIGKRKRIKEYVCRIRQPLKKDPSIKIEYIGNDYEEGYMLITAPSPS
jgi:two-component response regulator